MQHDEIIWQVINQQFCSFKSKIAKERTFRRNENNVTGLCNRQSCPLANSRYATIREENGKLFLCLKTIERAHSPKNLWEKIRLSRNYEKAIEQLDEHLAYFPKFLVHRNKQRLTKIHQYLIRMRKLQLKVKPKIRGINKKVERREVRREVKALQAANLEKNIQKELLERLSKGTYGDIYNFPETEYNKALAQKEGEFGDQNELFQLEDELEAEEDEDDEIMEYVENLDDESSDEEYDDIEDSEFYQDGEGGEEDEDDGDSGMDDDDDDDDEVVFGGEGEGEKEGGDSDGDLEEKKKPKPKPSKKDKKGKKKASKKKTLYEIEYEDEEANGVEMAGEAW